MSYDLNDIKHETPHFWVIEVTTGYEVYQTGLTHSTRVARIGYQTNGLQKAIDECNRRQTLKDSQ